jgi:sec-independent protein translocase protein TatC
VDRAATPIEDSSAREVQMRDVTRNATILKDQLDKDPGAKLEALAKRRDELTRRMAALKVEQEKLLGHPDAVKLEQLEKDRAALTADVARYADDIKSDVAPLLDSDVHVANTKIITLGYTEGFMGYLRVAMVFALFVASPLVARELWKFVSAGLHRHEKRYVTYFAPLTFVAFIMGACFGYFILIPAGLKFLAMYGDADMEGQFNLAAYLSLFLQFTLVVGLIFELPLIMNFMTLIGFMTPEKFSGFRRYWVLVAFVLAAILAPAGDPISLCLCAAPLLVLYEVGIVSSRWLLRGKKPVPAEPVAVAP